MNPSADALRAELAVAAARLIAEDGCDYAQAKRRAARELLGERDARGVLPDNGEIEVELRRHLALFAAESHPALLATLRRTALHLMEQLEAFQPHLVGAVLGGTATEHSNIELHLYTDSAKDVEMRLLDAGIDFDVGEPPGDSRPAPQECIGFVRPVRDGAAPQLRAVGVRLHVYDHDAIRVAPRHRATGAPEQALHPVAASGRADIAALRRLLADAA